MQQRCETLLRSVSGASQSARKVFVALARIMPKPKPKKPFVPLIQLTGTISANSGGNSFQNSSKLNYENCEKTIREAFKSLDAEKKLETEEDSSKTIRSFVTRKAQPNAKNLVIIVVNSPGGSPVQSFMLYRLIRKEAEKRRALVKVIIEDVAASGGYMIACAGDEIIATCGSSIVGSIGVISGNFGVVNLMKQYGIERRIYTAGKNKMINDPFSEEKSENVTKLKSVLQELHAQFIQLVVERRKDRLLKKVLADKEGTPAKTPPASPEGATSVVRYTLPPFIDYNIDGDTLFNGDFFTAEKGLQLGLVDRLGFIDDILEAEFGTSDAVEIKRFGKPKSFLEKFLKGKANFPGIYHGSHQIGEGAVAALWAEIDSRAAWGRFGL